ncbi:MAG: hypothetical protein KatS3mg110_2057 [Pirellulaceae bacterium]|nr:MAG: hypothetical protein KatS3mg110_2057 [Pirellulaceae bacterium]
MPGKYWQSDRYSMFAAARNVGWTILIGVAVLSRAANLAGDDATGNQPTQLSPQLEDRWLEYRVVFELSGKLLWKTADGQGTTPVEVYSDQLYRERVDRLVETGLEKQPETDAAPLLHAARWYEQASARYRLAGKERSAQLAQERRLVILDRIGGRLRAYSPWEPLPREELDLLDLPFPTFALDALFPAGVVRIGESWDVPSAALVQCLPMDEVTSTDVQGKWVRSENGLALVEWNGTVAGRAEGAASRIQIQARGNVGLDDKVLRWLAVSIVEKRDIGEVQPGLEITARVRIVAQPPAAGQEPEEVAATLPEPLPEQAVLLVRTDNPRGRWSLLHDPAWRVVVERYDLTILRRFESSQLVAQLIATSLPDSPKDKQLSPTAFQQEILSALRPYSGQILETTEGVNRNQVRVLRASAVGLVGERSMQWYFYHLSDDEGHRASLVFTVESDKLEAFGESDRVIVETFAFGDGEPATATPAAAGSDGHSGDGGPQASVPGEPVSAEKAPQPLPR